MGRPRDPAEQRLTRLIELMTGALAGVALPLVPGPLPRLGAHASSSRSPSSLARRSA